MRLAPGIRLGPYEIVAPIGAGGMGEVYRARDTRLAREVALKVLSAEFAAIRNGLQPAAGHRAIARVRAAKCVGATSAAHQYSATIPRRKPAQRTLLTQRWSNASRYERR